MKRMTGIIILSVVAISVVVLFIGKINLSIAFHKEVAELFSQYEEISYKTFSYDQISGLPKPVQRYFRHVLREGQPYISTVRLMHNGQFKQDQAKEWVNIKGEQYFTAERPGFIWKGKTSLFTARDMYISEKGKIIVSLFSLFAVVKGEGQQYDHGELLRWLGESVWFPTNLLPSDRLQWTPVDSESAELNFDYNGLSLAYRVSFNQEGEITKLETKRYMGEDNLETWTGRVSEYQKINGMIIPMKIEAIWRLETGDFSYARFNVTKIEYGIAEKF